MKTRDGGFYYEINRSHPMVTIIENELGNDKKSLNALLSQIERSLPLNQLYIDLNNDEHISNEKTQDNKEIEKALREMLPDSFTQEEKVSFLDKLSSIPPYSKHRKTIENLKKEICRDE